VRERTTATSQSAERVLRRKFHLPAARSSSEDTHAPLPDLPWLLTVDDVAALLRTTPKGIYIMAARGLLPGITRIGRRVLFRRDDLLHWLRQKSAPSPKE
jgi:excisionase family DNA binding protein